MKFSPCLDLNDGATPTKFYCCRLHGLGNTHLQSCGVSKISKELIGACRKNFGKNFLAGRILSCGSLICMKFCALVINTSVLIATKFH